MPTAIRVGAALGFLREEVIRLAEQRIVRDPVGDVEQQPFFADGLVIAGANEAGVGRRSGGDIGEEYSGEVGIRRMTLFDINVWMFLLIDIDRGQYAILLGGAAPACKRDRLDVLLKRRRRRQSPIQLRERRGKRSTGYTA